MCHMRVCVRTCVFACVHACVCVCELILYTDFSAHRYNSGGKEFRSVHSRQFSIFIDALTIHDHCWGKKR